jgi:hypothetical protein
MDGFLVSERLTFQMLNGLFPANKSLSIGPNLLKLLLGNSDNVSHFDQSPLKFVFWLVLGLTVCHRSYTVRLSSDRTP